METPFAFEISTILVYLRYGVSRGNFEGRWILQVTLKGCFSKMPRLKKSGFFENCKFLPKYLEQSAFKKSGNFGNFIGIFEKNVFFNVFCRTHKLVKKATFLLQKTL